ncbi:hypothetical protein K3M35_05305 [Rhodococcus sp. DMU2021]|uniref:hypothetical protein n=1 Tax=Rhodococcus sp. DMU2021 TaxID=2866997 RepID=UPI001C7DEDE7|nr:hypothetical protein [Rhodococcus sp. DMU2021]MBX4168084.1 hypothetical protein [Rhodococcus sp. DMU2021]
MSDPMTPEGRADLRQFLADGRNAEWSLCNDGRTVAEDASEEMAKWIADAGPCTAELIVAAVNALPALLDALEEAEKMADTKSKVADAFQQALTDEYRPHVEQNKAYGMALALQEEQLAELRDRAEKAEAALERQERELAGYRAEEQRVREWNALVNEGNVRCTWCDLRYAEREEYPCGDERDQNSHHYNADELAEARRKALDGDS